MSEKGGKYYKCFTKDQIYVTQPFYLNMNGKHGIIYHLIIIRSTSKHYDRTDL